MARGGLSNDPEKRERQLAALRRGNERAAARLTELGSPADPANDPEPASQPGKERVPVGKVSYPKPGKDGTASRAKPKPVSQAVTASKPGKPANDQPPANDDDPPPAKPRQPGFLDGLQLPRFRRDQ